jgi:hypothetical protein
MQAKRAASRARVTMNSPRLRASETCRWKRPEIHEKCIAATRDSHVGAFGGNRWGDSRTTQYAPKATDASANWCARNRKRNAPPPRVERLKSAGLSDSSGAPEISSRAKNSRVASPLRVAATARDTVRCEAMRNIRNVALICTKAEPVAQTPHAAKIRSAGIRPLLQRKKSGAEGGDQRPDSLGVPAVLGLELS